MVSGSTLIGLATALGVGLLIGVVAVAVSVQGLRQLGLSLLAGLVAAMWAPLLWR